MAQINDDVRKDLQDKHGEVAVYGTPLGDFAFRGCTEAEYERFNQQHDEPSTKVAAFKTLALTCCVWPGRDELATAFAKRPGLIHKAGNEVLTLSGLQATQFEKK
jgi:hypothetical protein